jgi:hypothetical protein
MDLKTQIEQFFTDAKSIMQVVAPVVAFLGFVGVGVMYMGSSWPLISKFKRDNPDMASTVILGLLFTIAASSLAALVSFS